MLFVSFHNKNYSSLTKKLGVFVNVQEIPRFLNKNQVLFIQRSSSDCPPNLNLHTKITFSKKLGFSGKSKHSAREIKRRNTEKSIYFELFWKTRVS